MKRLNVGLTACAVSLAFTASFAMADIDNTGEMSGGIVGSQGIFSYQILQDVALTDGSTINVFRVYADRNYMDSQNGLANEVLQSDGNSGDPHQFNTNGGDIWWLSGSAGNPPAPPDDFFFPFLPDSKYETFLTIGGAIDETSADNQYVGDLDWTSNGMSMSSTAGGTWAHLPGSPSQGLADNDAAAMGNGHTLMMQISTYGDSLTYDLNIKTRAGGNGSTWEGSGTIEIPAPGALALLGIAGLASRRRRRA